MLAITPVRRSSRIIWSYGEGVKPMVSIGDKGIYWGLSWGTAALLYLFRYSIGVRPVILRNTSLKALVSLYPTSNMTSFTFFRPVSRLLLAASILTRWIYS